MKSLLFAVAVAVSFASFADDAPQMVRGKDGKMHKVVPMTPERFQQIRYKHTGGYLVRPNSLKGKIVYVNAQKSVPVEWIRESATNFAEMTSFAVEVADGAFKFPNPTLVGDASLFVVDDENLPPLLSAPESKWAMVNVSPLKKGRGEKEAFLHARVEKELTRGFCLLAGTQTSNYPNSLLGVVTKPEQLDDFTDCRLPVDIPARFNAYVAGYGITPAETVTYKKACREGWAPSPTNDVQKKIWDDIRAIPTKPIKVEFDPKKGE